MSKVYLVGAGPGDAELITVKGKRLLEECDAVIYDRLASSELLKYTRAECVKIYVGKEAGHHSKTQEQIHEIMRKAAQRYQKIVRLKGGDPFVFGRGGEEALFLQEQGIPFEAVPGVTSAVAVPEAAGIPVTHRGICQSFHVITGHTGDGGLTENYGLLAQLGGTLVFLMGRSRLGEICGQLMHYGMDQNTAAAVISEGTTPRQQTVRGTLKDIEEKARKAGIKSPALIVVGSVCALPIRSGGKRLGVTATAHTAAKLRTLLEEKGFTVVETCNMEVIETREAENVLKKAVQPDVRWIMFTSPNGVRVFFRKLKEGGAALERLSEKKFAVIGAGSREELRKYGIEAHFMPGQYTSKALGTEFVRSVRNPGKILIPRAAAGSVELTSVLAAAGCDYEDLPIYDVKGKLAVGSEEMERIQCHVFVSASGVNAFFDEVERKLSDYRFGREIACIGEATKEALAKRGYRADLVSEVHDAEGLAGSLEKYYAEGEKEQKA